MLKFKKNYKIALFLCVCFLELQHYRSLKFPFLISYHY